MKKLLAIFILFFISYGAANAGVKEPGKINSLQCAIGTLDAYKEAKEYRESNPKKNTVIYMACNGSNYSWNWSRHKNLNTIHKRSFKDCTKNKYTTFID